MTVRRHRYSQKIRAIATTAILLPFLVGCAGESPTPYSDFERPQSELDVLPNAGDVGEAIAPESVRYAGSAEGIDVYLGLRDSDDRCVIVDSPDGPMSGCGGGELSKPGAWVVQLHPDEAAPENITGVEWTPLGKNISVRAD